ncbi:MAG: hypothetical protein H6560_21015 [Lewinellaceae bacterium]|nr:hypothetical protein [Lewinellaceae bacterium]
MKYCSIAFLLLILLSCEKWVLEKENFIKVEILSVEVLSLDSMRITGQIQGLTNGQIQDHGIVWSAQDTLPDILFNEGAVSLGAKNQEENLSFSDTLALAINTSYTLRAYATLDGVTFFYSEPIAYQTGAGSVITLEHVYESGLEVEFKGRLSGTDKGIVALQHGFCWSTEHIQPTLADNFEDLGYRRNDETFSHTLSGLQNETPYYFRAYAVRSINFKQDTSYGEVLVFDENLIFWTSRANFDGAGRHSAVGFSIGQKGYVGTGFGESSEFLKDFWEYDQLTDNWTQKADFEGGKRYSAVGFSIGTKGYIGTGIDEKLKPLKDFWEYDPQTDIWIKKADFEGGERYSAVGFSIGTKGYIGTGRALDIDSPHKKDFWEFNPLSDSWTEKPDFEGVKRGLAIGFSINEKGYIVTGVNNSSQPQNDFWEYDP